MYKLHQTCRACGYARQPAPGTKAGATNERLKPVFDLGIQPLANDFCSEDEERKGYAPLKVLLCPRCFLGQLSVTVNPEQLYANYRYVTSPSATMKDHFHRLMIEMGRYQTLGKVLEIGSNDGLFLEYLKRQGYGVMGVDPAKNLCQTSVDRGIATWHGFFGNQFLNENPSMVGGGLAPDFIFARHVFCHVDNWRDFISAIERMCHRETVTFIEVPYVMDLLERGEFDTIYHEHTSYLSLQSIEALLFPTGLRLHRVERFSIHGGALLLTIVRKDYPKDQDRSVLQVLSQEQCGEREWREFSIASEAKIDALRSYVRQARTNGKRVVGYGASAKSTVWINACGFRRSELEAVYDYTPEKLYRFIPGTDIPIAHEGGFYVDNPDIAICFAWNFLPEVLTRQSKWIAGGGKFIVPHPEIRVISKDTPAESACVEEEVGCKAG